MIDPHVHCRDGIEAYKTTIAEVFGLAKRQGVERIFDMPNTDPPILTRTDVKKRLRLVPESCKKNYFLYVGATSDEDQLEEAVRCYSLFDEVIGLKLYAAPTTGDLAVIKSEEQKKVYKNLARLDYKRVIAVHCEKKEYFRPELWKPQYPKTHSDVRPEEAEIESVRDQISLAAGAVFKGILHVPHISSPDSVELVAEARKVMKITCGVTPHHIIWNDDMLRRPDGLIYKTNPPLRDRASVERLRKHLAEGRIDWIETDHAPHTRREKMRHPYLSGYPSLRLYRDFVEQYLPAIGLSSHQIEDLTYNNIHRTFRDKLDYV